MEKTLKDILQAQDSGNVENAIASLTTYLNDHKNTEVYAIVDTIKQLIEAQKESHRLLQELISKPDPVFPIPEKVVFPDFGKIVREEVARLPPPASFDDSGVIKAIEKSSVEIAKQIAEGHQIAEKRHKETGEAISNIHIPEPEKEKERTPMNLGSIRRHSRWQVVSTKKGTIAGVFDGINTKFYLPTAPIPNSEQVRLNGGSPLANGEDYTLSGNLMTFVLAPVANSTCEVRYQS